MKYEVKLFNAIAPVAVKKLNSFGIKEGAADIVIARSAELKKDESINDSLIVARAGVGVNNIPVERLSEKLVPVVFAPGGNADSVSELTVGKVIDAYKRTMEAANFCKTFEKPSAELESLKKNFKGHQLRGSSICILGLGNIGTRVGYALAEMGMKVFIKDLGMTPEFVSSRLNACNGYAAKKMSEMMQNKEKKLKFQEKVDLAAVEDGDIVITMDDSIMYQVDAISAHIGAQKKPIFDAAFFAKAKKGIVLINTDRGTLVDEEALIKALDEKLVASYHTDFAPENLKLRKHPKTHSTPHIAASTDAAEENCAHMVVDSILNFVFEGNVINSKNYPDLVVPRKGKSRVVVAGKELKEGKVVEILKKHSLSVAQHKKAQKGKVTYAIFDVVESVQNAEEIAKQISKELNVKARFVPTHEKLAAKEVAGSKQKKEVWNFSAGPAILPSFVVENLIKDMGEFQDTGMSVAEMSHRDKPIVNMVLETADLVKKALKVPENYKVLFLQGGATLQFSMVPMNLSSKGDKIGYIEQGAWSKKAVADAKTGDKLGLNGTPVIIASNLKEKSRHNPKIPEQIPQDLKFLHVCTNETIHGIEMRDLPDTGKVPLVLDASSNIFSHPIDWSKNIGLIYAGAQKNSGMSGVTLMIIRDDLINKDKVLPNYLKISNHADNDSEYNTPPVVSILSINYMMKWLFSQGGVEAIEKLNEKKAGHLYKCFEESNGFYIPRVDVLKEQSRMNVVWNLKTEDLEKKFLAEAGKRGMSGLKGHRDLKGIRASIYNGFPEAGCVALVDFMKEFQKKHEKQ